MQRASVMELEVNKLPVLGLLALIFWFSSLSVYSISIDQEFAAFQAGPTWWVQQGRWTTHLLTYYVFPQPVVPYLPHLILCAALSVSYVVLLAAHGLRCDARALLTFPLFLAFPTWYFIAEFYANLLSVAVGLLLCSVAFAMYAHAMRQCAAGRFSTARCASVLVLAAVVLAGALGTYQSYLLLFVAMVLGGLLIGRVEGRAIDRAVDDAAFPALDKVAWAVLFLAGLSVTFYYLIAWLFRVRLQVGEAYVASFINVQKLREEPLAVLRSVLDEALRFYAGDAGLFGVSIAGCGAVIALSLAALILQSRSMGRVVQAVALYVAILAAPFGLHVLAGGGGQMPYRAMVAAPYVVWLMGMVALYARQALFRKAAMVCLAVAAFQLLNAHASYSGARSLALAHDRELAAALYARIVDQFPEFDRNGQQKVDFFGAKPFASVLPKPYSSTAGFSFFEWDAGNPVRVIYFMRLLGYEGLKLITTTEREQLITNYAEMPIWPAKASVRKVGDIVLVKLGHFPGVRHDVHFNLIDVDGMAK